MAKPSETTAADWIPAMPLRIFSRPITVSALAAVSVLLLAYGYVSLVRPDATVIAVFLNDVFGLADAGYRIAAGRMPSTDFDTVYGIAVFYPTAIGFRLGYSAGGALAFGHLVTALALLTAACAAVHRRLPLFVALALLVYLFLLIVVPVRPGGVYSDLTYGIYYTRHGWAALAIVALFYLEPLRPGRADLPLDAAVLTTLLLYLVYLKITFALVALAFVVAIGLTSGYKFRLAAISLGAFLAVFGAIHLFTEYNAAYLDDVFAVVDRTSTIRRGRHLMFWNLMDHLGPILLCLTALGALLVKGHRMIFDVAFVGAAVIASLMLADQSGATSSILPTLIMLLLVLGELLRRAESAAAISPGANQDSIGLAPMMVLGMALAVMAGPAIVKIRALNTLENLLARAEARDDALSLSGLVVLPPGSRNDQNLVLHESLGHAGAAHEQFNVVRDGELGAWEYMALVQEGVELLETVPLDDRSLVVFEHTNAFNVPLGLRPTSGGYALHWLKPLRTAPESPDDAEDYRRAAERFFSDADYVMVPEVPYSTKQMTAMMQRYGVYLEENFRLGARSPHWRLYER